MSEQSERYAIYLGILKQMFICVYMSVMCGEQTRGLICIEYGTQLLVAKSRQISVMGEITQTIMKWQLFKI